MPRPNDRPPINVALVIDTSGSMKGEKIVQAREAAVQAIHRLEADDIVAVVNYDKDANVVVPATKATDVASITQPIETLQAGGNTALFAGVTKGAHEIRKFFDETRVNRVLLLSDGQANRGPSSPSELGRLGASLVKEGISVSTFGLGLGYNEDLMSELAFSGSGNHLFVESSNDLSETFANEFNDLMSVVAGDFEIELNVADGVRPVRVLNAEADIEGQSVYLPLTQIYSKQKRYFVVELEVPSGKKGETKDLLSVSASFMDLMQQSSSTLTSSIDVKFSDDADMVAKSCNLETLALCTVQIANERNRNATALRDRGDVDGARALLNKNAEQLEDLRFICAENGVDTVVDDLTLNLEMNRSQAAQIDDKDWNESRKSMRSFQNFNSVQQTYRSKTSGAKK
ncbi:MAG: VWA domain-containing protein [Planctomycetota bacterium]